jgi:hypothetical protein
MFRRTIFFQTPRLSLFIIGLLVCIGLVSLRPSWVNAALNAPATFGPTTVFLSSATQVPLGQSTTLQLLVHNAKNLAGFQATLTFDPNVIHLTQAQVSAELSATGRGVVALGPYIRPQAATVGAATCPILDCTNLTAARQALSEPPGVSGQITLAEFEIVVVAPGAHTLMLSEVQLVAPDGALLDATTTPFFTLTSIP